MTFTFRRMTAGDADVLTSFLTSNTFPFHASPAPTAAQARDRVQQGHFWSTAAQGYWIQDGNQDLGLVVVEDPEDENPMFDLRLAEEHRGQGRGAGILRALCGLVFTGHAGSVRFEGQTREDNIAMRKTFLRAGFVKEAHYRQAWPTADGSRVASVAYAILRSDWETNTVTALEFDDFPFCDPQ
ncbi:GNAT family protein [Arthrobacter sp. zg-Y1143]|uniref:GNAT family N-acetyltransferase n=1 Tax=Arthrobacter sp. zg-Y1143 TaxID=3049065 RepID=UPI0024C3D1C4|nr:GNAT family protein [Arthrobacter sp. zg-Y1143]MDK1326567.1 GNAT family protein [Arthrobacter sp. zg-Y1143]